MSCRAARGSARVARRRTGLVRMANLTTVKYSCHYGPQTGRLARGV